jgi:hypothetical protein
MRSATPAELAVVSALGSHARFEGPASSGVVFHALSIPPNLSRLLKLDGQPRRTSPVKVGMQKEAQKALEAILREQAERPSLLKRLEEAPARNWQTAWHTAETEPQNKLNRDGLVSGRV